MKPNPIFVVELKPRFKYHRASQLVKVCIENQRVEIRPRNGSNKVYSIPLHLLTTQRAITIATQYLAEQRWCSKEILTTFISVAMCMVPTESPTPVDVSHWLR